eukprot:TRINITY_DN4793_c0_g4_i3.p1 TRINITY_DN4793_c0_g4~~TRINITY_DN4793_c0_g4_i3.p1  ORF type:complete len:137 (-),score=15.62 TRINITY_DN4793_c0_g4_i3:233-643(-)
MIYVHSSPPLGKRPMPRTASYRCVCLVILLSNIIVLGIAFALIYLLVPRFAPGSTVENTYVTVNNFSNQTTAQNTTTQAANLGDLAIQDTRLSSPRTDKAMELYSSASLSVYSGTNHDLQIQATGTKPTRCSSSHS